MIQFYQNKTIYFLQYFEGETDRSNDEDSNIRLNKSMESSCSNEYIRDLIIWIWIFYNLWMCHNRWYLYIERERNNKAYNISITKEIILYPTQRDIHTQEEINQWHTDLKEKPPKRLDEPYGCTAKYCHQDCRGPNQELQNFDKWWSHLYLRHPYYR